MPKNAIVLMTALVPTTGHLDLIRFAENLVGDKGWVYVIVSNRSFEPVSGYKRVGALRRSFHDGQRVVIHDHADDEAPQNPDPKLEVTPGADMEFWKYWRDVVYNYTDPEDGDIIVASELYGKTLAKVCDLDFVPYDLHRQINDARGSDVRRIDLRWSWDNIAPEFRKDFQKKFVLFGQESVGKTTFARQLAEDAGCTSVPEFARGYLESVGAELTQEKMRMISQCQMAYELTVREKDDIHTVFLDTDLLSTIGYYRINGYHKLYEKDYMKLVRSYLQVSKDYTYFLLPDDIPFEKDILRYGGDKRESTYEFWKKLLEEFGCHFYEVPRVNRATKFDFIDNMVNVEFGKTFDPIRKFKRE